MELLTRPGLFFLDEPTSGLDPGTETALMQLMRRLADQRRTIIMVTHATKNVMLADKVVFLARGGTWPGLGRRMRRWPTLTSTAANATAAARPIEFDQIYAILDDPSRGNAEEWGKRYQAHAAYQKYIIRPLAELGHNLQAAGQAAAQPTPRRAEPVKRGRNKQVSALRQFFILSSRNVRISTRDRPAMVLMLAVSPIISMLDVVLSSVLGKDLFDYNNGNIANVITGVFMPIMYAVMVGALSQMREFVKESDIYKRERLVNLKVLPYVLSKVWVAAVLGLYQAMVYTIVHHLAFTDAWGSARVPSLLPHLIPGDICRDDAGTDVLRACAKRQRCSFNCHYVPPPPIYPGRSDDPCSRLHQRAHLGALDI